MRRILEILALLAIMVLFSGGGAAVPVVAAPGVTVSLGAPDEADPDSDFTANVNISQVVNFDACNYDISFDTSVLWLDDVTSGLIDSTPIPVDIYNEISPGKWTVVQNVPGLAGASGSGYLAVLHFHVVGTGSSPISLANGMLANNSAEEIAATWVGDSVAVVASVAISTTPPPAVSLSPEAAAPGTTAPAPVPPPAQPIKWPVLWGVIAGATAIGVIAFLRARRKAY
jgi:hypothetical protein